MPETTPLIKAALNLRVGAGFDVYLYLIQHDSYMSCLLYLRKIFLYTIECTLRKHSIVMNKKPTNIRFYSQCPKAQ